MLHTIHTTWHTQPCIKMKKLVIYLLLISFCGGTAETDLDPFAEEMLIAKDAMSEAQQETQKEYKESSSEKIDNCIELADAIEEVWHYTNWSIWKWNI